jgi:hypothetical protein
VAVFPQGDQTLRFRSPHVPHSRQRLPSVLVATSHSAGLARHTRSTGPTFCPWQVLFPESDLVSRFSIAFTMRLLISASLGCRLGPVKSFVQKCEVIGLRNRPCRGAQNSRLRPTGTKSALYTDLSSSATLTNPPTLHLIVIALKSPPFPNHYPIPTSDFNFFHNFPPISYPSPLPSHTLLTKFPLLNPPTSKWIGPLRPTNGESFAI